MHKIIIFLFSLLGIYHPAMAVNFYAHSEGWHWYHDPQATKKQAAPIEQNGDPVAAMKALQQQVNVALDRAILFPTQANVKDYMALQNRVTAQTAIFTNVWKQVLVENPALDYSIAHPTSSLGRTVYLKQYRENQDKVIQQFAHQYGLFFFYRGDCPYCHQFAPILKAFSDHYGVTVIPISLGGGMLAQFPNSRADNGQAARLHVEVTPSLFAVDPRAQKIIPVAYGFMSDDALGQRIFHIMTTLKSNTR